MEEINKTGVTSLAELREMRSGLRMQVAEKEVEIIDHFRPVSKLIGLFSRKKDRNADGSEKKSIISTAAKIVFPLMLGRKVLKNKKKFLLLPLLGYLAKQGADYAFSKPIKEHVEDFKNKFHKEKPEIIEDVR